MKKKLTTLVVSSLLLTSTLTACSSGSELNSASDGGKKTVTLSVLKKDDFLQEAERQYEQKNPNIDIDIREYSATAASEDKNINGTRTQMRNPSSDNTNPADLEKYRTKVNTELMSGKGSDLIALENLPYSKYANKNLLANLDEWISKDNNFKVSDYSSGILDAVKVNDATFGIPIKYTMKMFIGNTPLLSKQGITVDDAKWTWKDILDIGQKAAQAAGNGIPVLIGKPKTELISDIVKGEYSQLVSGKKAAFDTPEFVGLLEQIAGLYNKGLIKEQFSLNGVNDDVFRAMNFQNPGDLLLISQSLYGGKGTIYKTPITNSTNSSVSFSADLMLGINEKSKNKEEAWKFLKFLLSDSMQSYQTPNSPMMAGFAVNKAAMKKQLQQAKDFFAGGKMRLSPDPNSALKVTDEQLNAVASLTDQAGSYHAGDPNVLKIVQEEAAAFFKKEKSAKDAAAMMQNRINTYLNE